MVNDWKEFLEKLKRNRALPIEKIAEAYVCGKEHHKDKMFIQVDWIEYDLQNHFLGEVARIEKEIDKLIPLDVEKKGKSFSFSLNIKTTFKIKELEGQLSYAKELAGVEQ